MYIYIYIERERYRERDRYIEREMYRTSPAVLAVEAQDALPHPDALAYDSIAHVHDSKTRKNSNNGNNSNSSNDSNDSKVIVK